MENITDRLLAFDPKFLIYGLTTPQMTFYNNGSKAAEMLNAAATDVMAARNVPIVNLYHRVEQYCGPVPYTYCDICVDYPDPCSYHYNTAGYQWIAANVSDAIRAALADVA